MTKKTDVWMPIYIGDYLKDTIFLSIKEHGAYLLLMMAYWQKGGPLASTEFYAICRDDKKIIEKMEVFFQKKDGFFRHKRIEKEMKKAKAIQKSNSKKAKKAANSRWKGKKVVKIY